MRRHGELGAVVRSVCGPPQLADHGGGGFKSAVHADPTLVWQRRSVLFAGALFCCAQKDFFLSGGELSSLLFGGGGLSLLRFDGSAHCKAAKPMEPLHAAVFICTNIRLPSARDLHLHSLANCLSFMAWGMGQ